MLLNYLSLPQGARKEEERGSWGAGAGGEYSEEDGTGKFQSSTWWKRPWSRGEHDEDGAISQNYNNLAHFQLLDTFGAMPRGQKGHRWTGRSEAGDAGLSKGFQLLGKPVGQPAFK